MAVCRKCGTENEEGLTRCTSCKAILPVKLGSKSEVRYERVRRKAELVGANCPKCGTVNPYTRFKCSSCGASLASRAKRTSSLEKVWVYVGVGAVVLAGVIAVALRAI